MHGTDLPPRPKSSPLSLRKYIFSTDYLLRGLYRSLLIAVIVIPILVIWDGPIKTNHVDGEYEAFDLVERQEIAPGHSYFVLKRKKPERYWWAWYEKERPEPVELAQRTPIMSLKIKNPSLQIQRSYTPLTLSPNEIHLVIKRYADGELSRFLHVLSPGLATVWVNQGRQEGVYPEGEWDHVVFVAGGTGITPAFQLCMTALQRQRFRAEIDPNVKKTRFSVLAAARDPQHVLLREEFKMMAEANDEGYLDVKYFVDRVPKGVKLHEDIMQGPITEKIVRSTIVPPSKGLLGWRTQKNTAPDKTMVLVCGPDGFTKYIAGEHGGVAERQGIKGGLLQHMDGIEVFKLLESRNEDFVQPPERRSKMPVMKVQ
jgi:cytochrome-b5 reductase